MRNYSYSSRNVEYFRSYFSCDLMVDINKMLFSWGMHDYLSLDFCYLKNGDEWREKSGSNTLFRYNCIFLSIFNVNKRFKNTLYSAIQNVEPICIFFVFNIFSFVSHLLFTKDLSQYQQDYCDHIRRRHSDNSALLIVICIQ